MSAENLVQAYLSTRILSDLLDNSYVLLYILIVFAGVAELADALA